MHVFLLSEPQLNTSRDVWECSFGHKADSEDTSEPLPESPGHGL